MNVQIGIIRYHTITDGMKYIIKLITLFHKFILHEQYKKVFIFFPIRFVDDGSARGYFIRVNMKIIQLFIVIDESLRDFCHSYFLGRCTF